MQVLVLLTAILTAWGGAARAQTAPKEPVNAEPTYQSSFAGYRAFKDEPVQAWRESNEAMQHLGGHIGHLNDAKAGSDGQAAARQGPADDKPSHGGKP